jgi:hypothetical protein
MHIIRKPRRTFVALAATALCALGGTAGFAASAQAASCPSTYACGWVDSGFGGARGQWAGANPHLSAFGQPQCQSGNWNDCISSDANSGTSCSVHWWWDWGYSGNENTVARGVFESSIGSANDQWSSNSWC